MEIASLVWSTRVNAHPFRYPSVWLVLLILAGFLSAQTLDGRLREIQELFAAGKYSFVLEKSLVILNTGEDSLKPLDAAALHYYVGMAYKNNRNNDLAIDYLRKIEWIFPASEYAGRAYLELAGMLEDDYFQRHGYLEKVYKGFPGTPGAVEAGMALVEDYLGLENYRSALPIVETLIKSWKMADSQPRLHLLAALTRGGLDDYSEAIAYLRQAEKASPNLVNQDPAHLAAAGRIAFNSFDFKAAAAYLQRLFNIYPAYKGIPAAAVILARALERDKKPFMAAVFLIKTLQKKPPQTYSYTLRLNLARILKDLPREDQTKIKRAYPLFAGWQDMLAQVRDHSPNLEERKTAVVLMSESCKNGKDWIKSLENLHRFLGKHRDPAVEKLFQEELQEKLDAYLHDPGKRSGAAELLDAWTRLENRKSFWSAQNLLTLAKIFYRRRLYAHAGEIYRFLLKYRMYEAHWPDAYKQSIRAAFRSGRYRECLELLKKIDTAAEPGRSEFDYYTLLCYRRLNREKDFANLANAIVNDWDGVNDRFQFRLMRITAPYMKTKRQYEKALKMYIKTAASPGLSREDRASVLTAAADLYYAAGDYRPALEHYEAALASGGVSSVDKEYILFRLAALHRLMHRCDKASNARIKLRKLNPGSFWLRRTPL
jgi:hypothetical protein